MSARKIYNDVPDAPVRIGQRVTVACCLDETGESLLIGRSGKVDYLEYSCGCGQSYPHDPMIGVRFPDGRIEEFWSDELTGQP